MKHKLWNDPQREEVLSYAEAMLRGHPLDWEARSIVAQELAEKFDLSNDCALINTIKVMKKLGGGKGGLSRY